MLDVYCLKCGFLASIEGPEYIAGVANNHSSRHSGYPIMKFIDVWPGGEAPPDDPKQSIRHWSDYQIAYLPDSPDLL